MKDSSDEELQPSVLVQSGGMYIYIQKVENFYPGEYGQKRKNERTEQRSASRLPAELDTAEAHAIWDRLKAAGWVDEHLQPAMPRWKRVLLADAMAKKLRIRNKWKVFESCWKMSSMNQEFQSAMKNPKSSSFYKEMSNLGL